MKKNLRLLLHVDTLTILHCIHMRAFVLLLVAPWHAVDVQLCQPWCNSWTCSQAAECGALSESDLARAGW